MAANEKSGGDRTESYLDNDIPFLLKVLFIGLIIWGIAFSVWFILGGYNSEKKYDAVRGGKAEVARFAETAS